MQKFALHEPLPINDYSISSAGERSPQKKTPRVSNAKTGSCLRRCRTSRPRSRRRKAGGRNEPDRARGTRRQQQPQVVQLPWQHPRLGRHAERSEEHTSELQSLMRRSYAVYCLKKKRKKANNICP